MSPPPALGGQSYPERSLCQALGTEPKNLLLGGSCFPKPSAPPGSVWQESRVPPRSRAGGTVLSGVQRDTLTLGLLHRALSAAGVRRAVRGDGCGWGSGNPSPDTPPPNKVQMSLPHMGCLTAAASLLPGVGWGRNHDGDPVFRIRMCPAQCAQLPCLLTCSLT